MLFVLAITTISVVYLGFEIRRGGLRIGPRPAPGTPRERPSSASFPPLPALPSGYAALLLPRLLVHACRVSGADRACVLAAAPEGYVVAAAHGLDEALIGARWTEPPVRGVVIPLGGDAGLLWAATAPTRSLGPSDLVLLDGFAARCGQVLAERSPVPSRDASIARTLALFGARQDAEATEAFTGLVLRVGARLGLDTVALAELEVAARLLHAARGSASIVGELPGFQGAAVLLRFASERWDGRGADGLRGERIPLGSRVLAACAAFANRPEGYRSARGGDTVLRRAQAGSGRTLDPAVVMALSVELLGPVPSIGDPGEPPDPAEWASGDRLFEGAFGQT